MYWAVLARSRSASVPSLSTTGRRKARPAHLGYRRGCRPPVRWSARPQRTPYLPAQNSLRLSIGGTPRTTCRTKRQSRPRSTARPRTRSSYGGQRARSSGRPLLSGLQSTPMYAWPFSACPSTAGLPSPATALARPPGPEAARRASRDQFAYGVDASLGWHDVELGSDRLVGVTMADVGDATDQGCAAALELRPHDRGHAPDHLSRRAAGRGRRRPLHQPAAGPRRGAVGRGRRRVPRRPRRLPRRPRRLSGQRRE